MYNNSFLQAAEDDGYDYDRLKVLDVSAAEASAHDVRHKRKKNPDMGFSTFEDATIRQYNNLTKQIKPDMEIYQQQKEELYVLYQIKLLYGDQVLMRGRYTG